MEKKSLSCEYLHHAVYLAPDELRHCCKRFFHKGEMKGDVKVIDIKSNDDFKVEDIINSKNELIRKLNNGEENDCTGCPYLERKNWPEINKKNFSLNLVSVESTSICSMKCTYCSDMYYGGLKPNYDVNNALKKLEVHITGNNEFELVWGGGEPLLLKGFDELLTKYTDIFKPKRNLVYSNALKYSKALEKMLSSNRAILTTSIDAGTPGMFKIIRGVKGIDKVFKNLKEYERFSHKKNGLCVNIIIKYIITDENINEEEIKGFLAYVSNYELNNCSFQLSSDFKKEVLSNDQILNVLKLYFGLKKIGAKLVFFDYHLSPRIKSGLEKLLKNNQENNFNLEPFIDIYNSGKQRDVIVWGAGDTGRLLTRNNFLFREKKLNIINYVDKNRNLIGKKVNNKDVKEIKTLKENNKEIAIASSAYFDEIYNEIIDLKIDPERIIDPIFI